MLPGRKMNTASGLAARACASSAEKSIWPNLGSASPAIGAV